MEKLILTSRWGDKLIFDMKESLEDTLKEANRYTVENDMTGFFFEVEDADPEYIRRENIPTFIDDYGKEIAPNKYDIER